MIPAESPSIVTARTSEFLPNGKWVIPRKRVGEAGRETENRILSANLVYGSVIKAD